MHLFLCPHCGRVLAFFSYTIFLAPDELIQFIAEEAINIESYKQLAYMELFKNVSRDEWQESLCHAQVYLPDQRRPMENAYGCASLKTICHILVLRQL